MRGVQELELRVYDIVLMDLHMPVIDGLEASLQIRDKYCEAERPTIVALSADTTQVLPSFQSSAGTLNWRCGTAAHLDSLLMCGTQVCCDWVPPGHRSLGQLPMSADLNALKR